MKQRILHGIVLILFILFLGCAGRQKMMDYDISYAYHPDKTILKSKYLLSNDSVHVYVGLINPTLFSTCTIEDFREYNKIFYILTPAQESREILDQDSLGTDRLNITKIGQNFYLTFTLPKINSQSKVKLTLERFDLLRKRTESDEIELDFELQEKNKNILLYSIRDEFPVLENYITIIDTVKIIRGNSEDTNSVFAQYIRNPLSPADPPHRLLNSATFPELKNDSLFKISSKEYFTFSKEGLYLIKENSFSQHGISVLVKGKKYPTITSSKEMIDPLIYITNQSDFKKISKSLNYKATLDSFWLTIGGSKDYSRTLIKSFYEKVEYSNKVFTTFKEGWKTDRGMIYIVFGKPDQVYRTGDTEEWYYENLQTQLVSFKFINKKNNFSADNYELVRNSQYDKFWYLAIQKWRNGISTE